MQNKAFNPNRGILLVFLNNLYKMSLKSVQPIPAKGTSINMNLDLDLGQGHYMGKVNMLT